MSGTRDGVCCIISGMGAGPHDIQFGLDDYPTPEHVTLVRFCRMPFDNACS